MSYLQKLPSYIAPEEYLHFEERAHTKHEYLNGVIYDWQGGGPKAMAGGSKDHNRVSANVYLALRTQLKGGPCEVFIADVRVSSADGAAYFYPDVVVTCAPADKARAVDIREPAVVVEVLSVSTDLFDRGDKFGLYRSFESLQAYVLVSPENRSIEVFTRADGWKKGSHLEAPRPVDTELFPLGTLGLHLRAADVFEGL